MLPAFIEPQLPKLATEPPASDRWLHEVKHDGYRMLARMDGGRARLISRHALDWTSRFPALAVELGGVPGGTVLDGEVCILNDAGVSDFEALQAAIGKLHTEEAVYFAFDLLFDGGVDLRNVPLEDRKERLEKLLGPRRHDLVVYVEPIVGNGPAVFQGARAMGLEGIVSKRRDAPYRPGLRPSWRKLKCFSRGNFIVLGIAPPDEKRQLGHGLVVGRKDESGQLRSCGIVRAGFQGRLAQELAPALAAAALPSSRRTRSSIAWLKPEIVVEVQHLGWTSDGQIRHASVKDIIAS